MALDITQDAAEVAIVAAGTAPTETDWITGTWVRTAPVDKLASNNRLTTDYWFVKVAGKVLQDGALVTDEAYLRVLVGPAGTVALPSDVSKVDVWSRVHDTPEVPVQKHGTVTIS